MAGKAGQLLDDIQMDNRTRPTLGAKEMVNHIFRVARRPREV